MLGTEEDLDERPLAAARRQGQNRIHNDLPSGPPTLRTAGH
jgi:hypothetical protein